MEYCDTPATVLLDIKKKLWITQLTNELNDPENIDIERKKNVKYQLNLINKDISNLEYNSNMDELYKSLDDQAYNTDWNKLLKSHKILKIKEYVKETYDSNEKLEEMLITAIDNNKLTPSKYIIYNKNLMKITDMPFVKECDNGEFIIRLDT
jgi:hypothetical protein